MSSLTDSVMQTAQIITRSVTSASAQSAIIKGGDGPFEIVCLHSDVDCYWEAGASPIATVSSEPLPAGILHYKKIISGQKIAVLRKNADGTLHIMRQV